MCVGLGGIVCIMTCVYDVHHDMRVYGMDLPLCKWDESTVFVQEAHRHVRKIQVARRMLKNPARTAALGSGSRLDPRALMGPLPSSHKKIPWKPEVVAVQQTVDLAGHGSVVYSSSFGRQDLDSAATSVDGDL